VRHIRLLCSMRDLRIQVETGKALAQSPVPSLERHGQGPFFFGLKK
jgi:hypothetical protein